MIIDPSAEYAFLGMSAGGRGFFKKALMSGSEIPPGRAFKVEPGDFVYSRLFAWRGSFEIAGASEEGCVVSREFPTFEVDHSKLDARWLRYWLLSDAGLREVSDRSAGSTPGSRNRLREDRFLSIPLPLPPIDWQRRVTERLDRIHAAATQLLHRSDHASKLISALAVSASARPDLDQDEKYRAGWRWIALGSVMRPVESRVTLDPSDSYPNVGIYSYGRGLFVKPNIDGATTSATALNRISAGQFIYSRLFAFEGAYSYVPPEFEGFFVSNEFPSFDPDPDQIDARWLANYLRSPERWLELGGSSKGLGVRRQRIPVEAVLAYEVWLPTIEHQRKTVAVIARLDDARAGRKRSEKRFGSLVPSALNEASASHS